jgi:hypothetical protein
MKETPTDLTRLSPIRFHVHRWMRAGMQQAKRSNRVLTEIIGISSPGEKNVPVCFDETL